MSLNLLNGGGGCLIVLWDKNDKTKIWNSNVVINIIFGSSSLNLTEKSGVTS